MIYRLEFSRPLAVGFPFTVNSAGVTCQGVVVGFHPGRNTSIWIIDVEIPDKQWWRMQRTVRSGA